MTAIEFENISKQYRLRVALKNGKFAAPMYDMAKNILKINDKK